MEEDLPQGGHDPAGRVLLPDGTPSGQEDHLALRQPLLHRPHKAVFPIGDDAVKAGQGSCLLQQGAYHGAVYIPNLAGGRGTLRRHQLIPGGDNPHPQPGHYGYCRYAQGSQGPNILGLQPAAGREYRVSGLHVIPPEDHVVARGYAFEDADGAVAIVLAKLQHLHCIRPLRHLPAGGDGGAVPRGQG